MYLLLILLANLTFEEGIASYYTNEESGIETASGEIFDDTELTCAMRTTQFGNHLLVIRKGTFQFVICKLIDHGPNVPGRLIDLSKSAMQQLKGIDKGLVPVYILSFRKDQA